MMKKEAILNYMISVLFERVERAGKIEVSDEVVLLENTSDRDIDDLEKRFREAKAFVEEKKGQKLGKMQYKLYPMEELYEKFGRPKRFHGKYGAIYDDEEDVYYLSGKSLETDSLVHETVHKYQNETGILDVYNSIKNTEFEPVSWMLCEGDAMRLDLIFSCKRVPKKDSSKPTILPFRSLIKYAAARSGLINTDTREINYKKFINLGEIMYRPLSIFLGEYKAHDYLKGAQYLCQLEDLGGEDFIDFALCFPQKELTKPAELHSYYQETLKRLEGMISHYRE
ncbi:MAG: hypothetical protein QMD85_00205 [Candidatus Aenigmarchaeota archaeon]|nr:hypothetical protein [Candidatus Aenigmarchaeota archaeon]MDI6721949.1 hypothetical protein [Candidatus Aenigmarchaeota archaeon]